MCVRACVMCACVRDVCVRDVRACVSDVRACVMCAVIENVADNSISRWMLRSPFVPMGRSVIHSCF